MTEDEIRERLRELHDEYVDDDAALGLIDGMLKSSHVDERELYDVEEIIREYEDPDIRMDIEFVKKFNQPLYEVLIRQ